MGLIKKLGGFGSGFGCGGCRNGDCRGVEVVGGFGFIFIFGLC